MRVVPEAAAPSFTPRHPDSFAQLARRLNLPSVPYALFVGTLEPRKNIPLLLEAFALVRRELNVQLLLVGGRGWLDEPIFAAHARSGLGDAARFVGSLGEDDLAILYSRAGVFVLPSLYEGFGLPVLEAMAAGKPVLCSTATSLPEVAGDAALYFDPVDPADMSRAIACLFEDPEQTARRVQRGCARAARFGNARTMACAYQQVFDELLAG
jgi:glycosyltransferase involved in cell wall biosynthesis